MKRILVVDDEAVLAETVRLFLDKKRYRTVSCHSAAEAKRLIESLCPDVVISDLVMPEMDGLELLNWIREQGYPCAFVLMSVKTSVFLPLARAKFKPDACLSKPFTALELRKAIESAVALSGRRREVEHV
jgi:CheY-like chemotaxis protein